MFFNLGGYEILVIAIVALLFVGPEQLPSVGRKVGRYAAQLRSMATGMREEFMAGMDGVPDLTKVDTWLGSGTDDDPIVPRGYAELQNTKPALGPVPTTSASIERP